MSLKYPIPARLFLSQGGTIINSQITLSPAPEAKSYRVVSRETDNSLVAEVLEDGEGSSMNIHLDTCWVLVDVVIK